VGTTQSEKMCQHVGVHTNRNFANYFQILIKRSLHITQFHKNLLHYQYAINLMFLFMTRINPFCSSEVGGGIPSIAGMSNLRPAQRIL
jgi:hypothetical protein